VILTEQFSVPQFSSLSLKTNENPRLGYIPALDGLRAIAILAVMSFHYATRPFVPGGSLGVDLFFVLSGFLITTLLLQEWASSGTISLTRFYLRRGLRLLPAMLVFLAFTTSVVVVLRGHDFTGYAPIQATTRNVVLALAYVYNWISASGDYRISGLGHFWSLAVEEQYYLIWPGFLLLLLRAHRSIRTILAASAAIFFVSASMPLWWPEPDFDRLFFGTDFRLQALIAGSILGQIYVAGLLNPSLIRGRPFKLATVSAGIALFALFFTLTNRPAFMEVGGYAFVALACCFLVSTAAFDAHSWLSRSLSNPVLTYIGRRSYGLYLWHYPFAFWLLDLSQAVQVPLAFAVTFAAAELSYHLVERPALRLKSRLGKPQSTDTEPTSKPVAESNPSTAA